MPYLTGLLEGFQARREREVAEQTRLDADRRAQEGKVFDYLLQSNDPQMRALALSGLFESAQPGRKKGGLSGYLGELQSGQIYPQVLAYMNELVPEDRAPSYGGGPTPPTPGSAAMSTNQTVRPGSQAISLPPGATPGGPAAIANPTIADELPPPPEPPPLQASAPFGPPLGRWKRRGTGVPTAEEIAEMNATLPLQAKIKQVTQAILGNGGTQEDVRRAVLGIAGAPQALDSTANGPVMAYAEDPDTPIPTIRHRNGTLTLADGTPLPAGMQGYVKPATGGAVTSTVKDSPEIRKQYNIPPELSNPMGWWKIRKSPAGNEYLPSGPPTEPPAYSGTTIVQTDTGESVVQGIPRGGVPGGVIGPAPNQGITQEQSDADALLATIDKTIAAEENRNPALRRPVTPQRRDQIALEVSRQNNLPYQTYLDVQRASRARPIPTPTANAPKTPRPTTTGGIDPEAIRRRALEIQNGGVPDRPTTGARSGGPGPRR